MEDKEDISILGCAACVIACVGDAVAASGSGMDMLKARKD
jgi:hypothetical protein